MRPELPDRIPTDVEIGSVVADVAYDTRTCRDAVAESGADAFIAESMLRMVDAEKTMLFGRI